MNPFEQNVIYTNDVQAALDGVIAREQPASVHILADSNTAPLLPLGMAGGGAGLTVIPPGDTHKTLDTARSVWQALERDGAGRRSLMVNFGGGVVSDLGGFAAATFKRGMRFVNVPTTLLAAVDAAVGGKTGVNFNGLKNEIGVFAPAVAVVVSTAFFPTLPRRELLSGYAEMLKHALLHSPAMLGRTLGADLTAAAAIPLALLEESVEVKRRIVAADPTERGLRRALNLGHTAGHAIEALALGRGREVPHGYAVAWGLVIELVLSHMLAGAPSSLLNSVGTCVRQLYGAPPFDCNDYPRLLTLMASDKKNIVPGEIVFTLLAGPGEPLTGVTAPRPDIEAALDIARDLLHA